MLKDFTPRLYQQTILNTAANNNTMVVLPTGMGKTAIALLLTAQRLTQYPHSKILLLAPTKPLCEQHQTTFKKHVDIEEEKIVLFTGSITPEKRVEMYKNAKIIISTPQCVTGDTIIFTKNKGPIPIEEFVESFSLKEKLYSEKKGFTANINEEILGFQDEKITFVKATKCWKLPSKKIIFFKTELQHELKCTTEHPLLTITEKGVIIWKKAEELDKNDYIATAKQAQFLEENINLYDLFKSSTLRLADSVLIHTLFLKLKEKGILDARYHNYEHRSMPLDQFFSDIQKINLILPPTLNITNETGRSGILTIPQKISPHLAYIIGAMLVDGHIGNLNKEHGHEVVYSELVYPSILNRFSQKVFTTFNIKESKYDPTKGLIYYSTAFAHVLNIFGVPEGHKSKIIRVPKLIFQSNTQTILSFVSGVLNADGDFHKNMIRVCSVNKQFIIDLRWLLLKLNITSSIEIRPPRKSKIGMREINGSESYHLLISGIENMQRLLVTEDIDIEKSKNLRKHLSIIKRKGTRSKEILPVKKAIKIAYQEHRQNKGKAMPTFCQAYQSGYLSKEFLKKNLPLLNSHTAKDLLKVIDLPFRWVKIKEKKEINTNEYVYDLTVEKEHNFVANLLINHNTVENDVINSHLHLEEVSLLIIDEAHHATGDYSYVWLAQQYDKLSPYSRIIALTASPGSDLEKIKEVCSNLKIEKIEIRTEDDPDVSPYVQQVKTNWLKVDFPPEFKQIQISLKTAIKNKLHAVQILGCCQGSDLTKGELLSLQIELQKKISSGEKDFEAFKSISLTAEALKLEHALELLETQGLKPLYKYVHKLQSESLTSKVKAVKNLVQDEHFKSAVHYIDELSSKEFPHPKLSKLKEIIIQEISQNSDAKIIIFTQYRVSAEIITKELDLLDIKNHIFVGQAKKEGLGFSQKQQKEILDNFRNNQFNILIATSVAEEGLDIPKVDKVIFYEPIPSAIRSIQRRGRTGRLEKGEVTVLVTSNTRDEAYRWSSFHKEKKMHRNLQELKQKFYLLNENKPTIANLNNFIRPTSKPITTILADHREKDNRIVKELIELNIPVKTAQLESADYVLSGHVGVELKHISDFVNSLIDGRLLEQMRQLKKNFPKSVLIIEGDEDIYSVRQVHPNAIRGMLASIALDFNIPILHTKTPKETAAMLAVMAKREQEKDRDFSLHERKPHTIKDQQEFFISSLPNIGIKTARTLLENFTSIKSLVNSKKEDLMNLEGIGSKTADKLLELFESKYLKKE